LIEAAMPMIAERAVEVPGNRPPLFRIASIVEQKMILVETIPMLHQDHRSQIADILVQIDSLPEELAHVRRSREIVAKALQLAHPFDFLCLLVVMTSVGFFRSEIPLISLVG